MTCQHGEDECSGNSYEQCAIDVYPDPKDYLPFITCFDQKSGQGALDDMMEGCATTASLDWSKIKSCHDDADHAWSLQVAAAAATPEDHTYVPWVVINGKQYDLEVETDFLGYVCNEYQGDKPAACTQKSVKCMKD